ncbi:MAG: DUF1365 domain-containing protein [Steroidobacteraceae bacterium]
MRASTSDHTNMHSALYTGLLRHRRFLPRPHAFSRRLFMTYLDLAEFDDVFRGRWLWSTHRPALAWLRREDYLGDPSLSIDSAARACIAERTGIRPAGPIRMLTHLRYFGLAFNPVTFYYCFDAADSHVESIVAEITNTPWNERHAYVLTAAERQPAKSVLRYRFDKTFHVSPFMPMQVSYDWRFGVPAQRLTVHMENIAQDRKLFDATLDLERYEISGIVLAKALAAFPCMTASVLGSIYYQALRLWSKRIPFYSHPGRNVNHASDVGAQR